MICGGLTFFLGLRHRNAREQNKQLLNYLKLQNDAIIQALALANPRSVPGGGKTVCPTQYFSNDDEEEDPTFQAPASSMSSEEESDVDNGHESPEFYSDTGKRSLYLSCWL